MRSVSRTLCALPLMVAVAAPLGTRAEGAGQPAVQADAPSDRARRPAVDPEAMEEALHPGAEPAYASPNAYRHYLRAKVAEAGGEAKTAIEELRLALAFDPDSAELLLAIGWIHAREGHFDAAASAAERAVRLEPRRWEAHLLLGKVRVEQKGKKAAAASLTRAVVLAAEEAGGRERLERFVARFGDPRLREAVEARVQEANATAGARAVHGR